jgi:hypothetical protein
MTDSTSFRQRLDAVLRTRDVHKVSAFLIEEDQWSPGTPADPEFAMWLMIASRSNFKDLHSEARQWLIEHGHTEEAEAVLSRYHDNRPGANAGRRPGAAQQKKIGQKRAPRND